MATAALEKMFSIYALEEEDVISPSDFVSALDSGELEEVRSSCVLSYLAGMKVSQAKQLPFVFDISRVNI